MRQKVRTQQKPAVKLLTRDGNFVCAIEVWRYNLGINLDPKDRGIHWIAIISQLCFIITTISQVISLVQATDDTAKLFECISVISCCGLGVLKMFSLRGRQQSWYSMLSRASDLEIQQLKCENPMNVDYESEDEEDKIHEQQITKYTEKNIFITNLLSKSYVASCSIFIASPFIVYTISKIQGAHILEYPHILPVWTRLEKIYFPIYIVTIVAEAISAAYCVCVHIVFDLSLVGMLIYIHGQFSLLRASCERIGGKGRKYDLSPKRDLRAHLRISRCQQIHASLIKAVNEVSNLSNTILGIYFNIATLTLCSIALQVSNDSNITHQLTLLPYLCGLLTQMVLFCKFGDDVINASSFSLGEGPSASAWWCLSPHIRREVALLCVSMSRQCRLLAGPFHLVNWPTFIQIIRTAYSYYAVIRQRSNN